MGSEMCIRDSTVHEVFQTQRIEHAFLEPESTLAVPDGNGHLHVYSGGQGVWDDRDQIASLLGVGTDVVTVELVSNGGAFGGKEDRVGAITPPIGIVLGAIGGCMVPLEVFSPTMRSVAHLVPQFWAMSAWQQLIFDGAGIDDIAGPLLALAGFAAVFLSGAVWALHRSLLRGAT